MTTVRPARTCRPLPSPRDPGGHPGRRGTVMRIHVGRWLRRGLLIGGAAGLAAAVLPGTPAWASPSCGSTLTTNTTLTADLVCAGDGLIIGADGITLNLGGHTITRTPRGNGINDGFGGSGQLYKQTIRYRRVNAVHNRRYTGQVQNGQVLRVLSQKNR